jgi:hypothetical protein
MEIFQNTLGPSIVAALATPAVPAIEVAANPDNNEAITRFFPNVRNVIIFSNWLELLS